MEGVSRFLPPGTEIAIFSTGNPPRFFEPTDMQQGGAGTGEITGWAEAHPPFIVRAALNQPIHDQLGRLGPKIFL